MANRNRNGGMKMLNFTYYTPTKVVFGRNAEAQTANLVREFGGKKLLIITAAGASSARGSCSASRIRWTRQAFRM